MITMHTTFPDGSTSEARFNGPMDLMLDLVAPWGSHDTHVDLPIVREFDTVEDVIDRLAGLGGES